MIPRVLCPDDRRPPARRLSRPPPPTLKGGRAEGDPYAQAYVAPQRSREGQHFQVRSFGQGG
eukprot:15378543-Alexandrium_andersonii.AAC.1